MSRALITIHGYLTDVNDFGVLYDKVGFYDGVFKYVIPGHDQDGNVKDFVKKDVLSDLLSYFDNVASSYDQVDVAGYSLGGALACILATERNVNKLVLLSPALKIFNLKSSSAQRKLGRNLYNEYLLKATGSNAERKRYARTQSKQYLNRYKVVAREWIRNTFPKVTLCNFCKLVRLSNLSVKRLKSHGKLAVPTLLVWGNCDQFVPYRAVQTARKYFADLQVFTQYQLDHSLLRSSYNGFVADEIVHFVR